MKKTFKGRKTFHQELYDENDRLGKRAGVELFEQIFDVKIIDLEKELYKKGDLYFEDKDGNKILVEIEVKNVGWVGKFFRYKTLHFAYKPSNKSNYFVSFNKKLTMAIVCKGGDLIREENIVHKNTKNKFSGQVTENEPFYEIKLSNCDIYEKVENKWKKQ